MMVREQDYCMIDEGCWAKNINLSNISLHGMKRWKWILLSVSDTYWRDKMKELKSSSESDAKLDRMLA